MAEPSAIWSTRLIIFDTSISHTQNVILSHARYALQSLIGKIDQLRILIASQPHLVDIYIHPEIPGLLSDIAFQQGTASTIMFNDAPKGPKENSQSYQLRLGRVAYVKKHCAGYPMVVLPDRKIRNSLTHIDEYLARSLAKPNTGWCIDMAIGRRDQFAPANPDISVGFCRAYIASEDIILHLDGEISVSGLRSDAVTALRAIWGE